MGTTWRNHSENAWFGADLSWQPRAVAYCGLAGLSINFYHSGL